MPINFNPDGVNPSDYAAAIRGPECTPAASPVAATLDTNAIPSCTRGNFQAGIAPQPVNIQQASPPATTPTAPAVNPDGAVGKLNRPALDWRVSGPFPQTLFLGCSVLDFNVSLDWGNSDGSSLTVTLIRDNMPTLSVSLSAIAQKGSRFYGMDYAAIKTAAESVKDVPNHYYNNMVPPEATREALRLALAALPDNYTEAQYRAIIDQYPWSPPAPFKDNNGNGIIPGKLYYYNNNGVFEQRYWLGPDPGFIADPDPDHNKWSYNGKTGEGINIIGAPVRFKCGDFEFCGVVSDWKKSMGSSGLQYTVTVTTPAYLLRNADLIVGHYPGTVYTKNTALATVAPPPRADFDNTIPLKTWETTYQTKYANAFTNGTRTYKSYISGPINITGPALTGSFTGDIKNDGNLPNVFNLYGYLETYGPLGFGGARRNDMGVKYNLLVGALEVLTNGSVPLADFGQFGAYGGLVGSCAEPPYKYNDNTDNNWTTPLIVGGAPTAQHEIATPDQNRLGVIAGADNPAAKDTPPGWITQGYGSMTMWDVGFIPPGLHGPSNTYKQIYYLDLTELPAMPDLMRYDSSGNPTISLSEFIDDICDKGGCDYFWEHVYYAQRNFLKLRTVSRKTQPPDNAVLQYLKGYRGARTSVEYGQELNTNARTRSMYIGGYQKRLVQVKNFRLGKSQSSYIYSPFTKKFVVINTKEKNRIRLPNVGSTRNPYNLVMGAANTNLNELSNNYWGNDTNWNVSGAGAGAQAETDDENKGVELNQFGQSADTRAGRGVITESSYTNIGNYQLSTAKAYNFNDLVTWTAKIRSTADTTSDTMATKVGKTILKAYTYVAEWMNNTADYIDGIGRRWSNPYSTNVSGRVTSGRVQSSTLTNTDSEGVNSTKRPKTVKTKITTLNRFFPLMHDVICPYFGSYKILPIDGFANIANDNEFIKTPRPVWYDLWTNQVVIVFSVADLPMTGLPLLGTYNGGKSFIVTETELRAAMSGFDTWRDYCAAKTFKPDIITMIRNFLCPPTNPPTIPGDDDPQTGTNSGNPDKRNSPAATRQAGDIEDGGAGGAASSVPPAGSVFDINHIDNCDYCEWFKGLFSFPKMNINNSSVLYAKNPINIGMTMPGAYDAMKIIHRFFENVAKTYYGRQFMVKLPMIRTYIDREVYYINEGGSSSTLAFLDPIKIFEGDGRIYTNWQVSPAGAWEEPGNAIDDSIVVGGWYANIFQNDQGLIGPILGFWSSMNFDYESYFVCKLMSNSLTDPESTKGAAFKIGDFIHNQYGCVSQAVIPTSTDAASDGSPTTTVTTNPTAKGLGKSVPPPP